MTTYEPQKNSEMFFKLFHYISGNNTAGKKISKLNPIINKKYNNILKSPSTGKLSQFQPNFAKTILG